MWRRCSLHQDPQNPKLETVASGSFCQGLGSRGLRTLRFRVRGVECGVWGVGGRVGLFWCFTFRVSCTLGRVSWAPLLPPSILSSLGSPRKQP